ncbi:hypothetical protein HHK36_021934 [Tetracentron sinense]|uniref:Uncharacterized protein n=1 Tax=Tetracentron sinense TaxID=13715 RepID=A0A834YSK0_TETSI|nr:hypothetical protein HHK36_021934 [Tetracentron sinense]
MASFSSLFCIFVLYAILPIPTTCHEHFQLPEKHVAFFIFGDSLFDAGNNNYINTTTDSQANFWPYGETFFKYPTGRLSDGRIIPDFIAKYAKLPLIPPFQQPGFHQFTDGANFASAGAGALVETFQGLVIDLKTQLSNFEKVERWLRHKFGDAETNKVLSKAVYLMTIGGNDYISPFLLNSSLFESHSRPEYVDMVIGNLTSVIKEIYKRGGRKFAFVGLGPLGCLPGSRILKPENEGGCTEELTVLAKLHNKALSELLKKLESKLIGFKYSNSNPYTPLSKRIDHPMRYGFKEGKTACCGTGPFRGVFSCGGEKAVKEYELCANVSEYVFFDSFHVTERVNQQFSELMWSGAPSVVGPYNLKSLFRCA